MELITTALQGRLSFEDNFNVEPPRKFELNDDVPVEITLQVLRGRPIGVFVLESRDRANALFFDYPRLAWRIITEKKIEVKVKWDTTPTNKIETTLLVVGS